MSYRKQQSLAPVIVSMPMMLQNGTQATSLDVSSFTTKITQPDGTEITDFTPPTITNPLSSGEYYLNFPTNAASLAFTQVNEPNPYVVSLDHPETDVEPMARDVWISDRYIWELSKEVRDTETVVIADNPNRIPRVEAEDTYRFVQNFITEPLSVQVSVLTPAATYVASLDSATQSSDLITYHYDYTTTRSWYTTVDSSGRYCIEWTVVRSEGNDVKRHYFEVVLKD